MIRTVFTITCIIFFSGSPFGQQPRTPDQLYKQLFTDVQLSGIFPDSKTFPDCIARRPPSKILSTYLAVSNNPRIKFSLKRFVEEYFIIPQAVPVSIQAPHTLDVSSHIKLLWRSLQRSPDSNLLERSSLIPLPHPYIVPGGRFREIYYWDSYFTMLGLKEDGEIEIIENMLDNFSYLIATYGHIPNGNRSYYLSRSQPPFFSMMVQLLAEIKGEQVLKKYIPAVEKEYRYWMKKTASPSSAIVVNGYTVNRYWDEEQKPRQESFREDVEAFNSRYHKPNHIHRFYRHIRAAAASGWDFSSRWFADTFSLNTIQTLDIIPVDLNCLLYATETMLADYYKKRDKAAHRHYQALASRRKHFINTFLYNKEDQWYYDYHITKQRQIKIRSAATTFPLFVGITPFDQAPGIAKNLEKYLLRPGGLVTSTFKTGQQWDAPNGWAPLQWICITGLQHYKQNALADTIAHRWVRLNTAVFKRTGKLMEKYNVEDLSLEAGGGEYPTQDGFGWTNGVLQALLKKYPGFVNR